MVETTGKQLSNARLAKGLTVDDVAFATKLRPDKVLALEHDDYSRFPNNAYVKGFLQIYGRYLGVDVRTAVKELENPNPVSISDYQYLNSAPEPRSERVNLRRPSNKPSIAPLIVFIVLSVAVAGAGYLYLNAQRLGDLDPLRSDGTATGAAGENAGETKAAASTEPAPAVSQIPAETNADRQAATPDEIPRMPPVAAPPAATIESAKVPPVGLSDRDFISQTTPAPGVTAASSVHEVVLEPVKKTWVTVRRDDPNSAPIFDDYLYTNAPSLKLRGARFFIEVRDEGAVNIRKDGAPIAYQGSGVTIQ